jgi:hypothetical protein
MKKPPDANTTLKRRKSLELFSQSLPNKAKMRIVKTILMALETETLAAHQQLIYECQMRLDLFIVDDAGA